jgi:prepilin-type N-terminal cleavage/methylation domain-containing protein
MKMNKKGFTLIELLIVVAIIAILAAIAIPQFSQYRIKGYNASAMTDVRNVRTSEEALYADWQRYGISATGAAPYLPGPGAAAGGPGVLLLGPTNPAANETVLTTTDPNGTARGLDIAVGNNINLKANSDAVNINTTYTIAAKNVAGDTVYGADSDSTANFRAQNTLWANIALETAPTPAVPAATTGVINFLAPFAAM